MGPNWNTGQYAGQDGIYVAQFKFTSSSLWDVGGLFSYLNDIEIDDGEDVLVKKDLTEPRFALEVISSSVKSVRLRLQKE